MHVRGVRVSRVIIIFLLHHACTRCKSKQSNKNITVRVINQSDGPITLTPWLYIPQKMNASVVDAGMKKIYGPERKMSASTACECTVNSRKGPLIPSLVARQESPYDVLVCVCVCV